MPKKHILFFTTTIGWAACEELWSQAAAELVKQGFAVTASVVETTPLHPLIENLKSAGIDVLPRPAGYPLWQRALHYARGIKAKWVMEVEKVLRQNPPQLVVFSEGATYPPLELIELCVARKLPFATISHKNWDAQWQEDPIAERYRNVLALARRCYFVSEANLRLAERQLGVRFANAEVVRNPYNVDYDAALDWPSGLDGELRLACVARLDPAQKGQDLLFEALAGPLWADRSWRLSLYGEGPFHNALKRLAAQFKISARIEFAGHVGSVEQIWASNHVLVMPSRYEGLPLAMVEAMLCARPLLATDVAGHAEVIIDGVTGFLAGPPTVAAVAQGFERLWASRGRLEELGKAGAKRIRELVPADPAHVFSEKLKLLVG